MLQSLVQLASLSKGKSKGVLGIAVVWSGDIQRMLPKRYVVAPEANLTVCLDGENSEEPRSRPSDQAPAVPPRSQISCTPYGSDGNADRWQVGIAIRHSLRTDLNK